LFNPTQFESRFLASVPIDDSRRQGSRQVAGACASLVEPTPTKKPELVAWSQDVGALLDIREEPVADARAALADVLSGNLVLPGMVPFAACYGGHQFGNWAGQLGDGRAMTLTELVSSKGERWELQLKGAGPTPYSRGSDGRAVLRSSLREFVCSEAMFHLGVPTTRALSLATTGDKVVRDMFYDGNPEAEPGAIVCRVAPTFLRFGSFELHRARGDIDTLRKLAEYTLSVIYPHLGEPSQDTYLRLLREVCERTALMIAHWMRVGFVHGVMNTDNMSVLGLTIDYGPYGWLEPFDPGWTPNTTDAAGKRYRFGAQPQVALWNLMRFGEALLPLVDSVELVTQALGSYEQAFVRHSEAMTRAKLGLPAATSPGASTEDEAMMRSLFELLAREEVDMTLLFRALADVDVLAAASTDARFASISHAYYSEPSAGLATEMREWLVRYAERVRMVEARHLGMNQTNPLYVPRNYLAQTCIDAAHRGDFSELHAWTKVLKRPYEIQPGNEKYAKKRPEWARVKPGSSMLSCSS
jgi:serine/tyrosine/threonine adenylyltransferase